MLQTEYAPNNMCSLKSISQYLGIGGGDHAWYNFCSFHCSKCSIRKKDLCGSQFEITAHHTEEGRVQESGTGCHDASTVGKLRRQ